MERRWARRLLGQAGDGADDGRGQLERLRVQGTRRQLTRQWAQRSWHERLLTQVGPEDGGGTTRREDPLLR